MKVGDYVVYRGELHRIVFQGPIFGEYDIAPVGCWQIQYAIPASALSPVPQQARCPWDEFKPERSIA